MNHTTPPTPKGVPAPNRAAPTTRKRVRRRLLLIACSTFLLLWLAVSQSGILARFVVPLIGAALPCDVMCGRVTMDPFGRITIRDVKLSVPSLTGPAAEFMTAPIVIARLDWGSVLSGSPRIASIELHSPVTRISVAPDQTLNVASLRGGGASPGQIPQLILTRAKFELGEHDPTIGTYVELFTLRVEGAMRAHSTTANLYSINLSEILSQQDRAHRTPTSINGWFNVSTIEGSITVHDVDLASWSERAAPQAVRELWEQMAMRGRIEDARFAFSSKELLEATFALKNVDMRIPLQHEPEAGTPQDATPELVSMTGVSGSLRFDLDGFQGDLAGQIEDLACHVTIRTDGLTLNAPLVCNIRAADFTVAQHPQLMPFAPPYVERIFRRFSGPTAEVSGVVRVERGPPVNASPAPLDVSGAFTFEHGQASFENFPYPFHNMRGTINFDADRIDIVHISARGPSGSSLLASGTIAPPREGAAVDLEITVADMPIDEVFYEAMPPQHVQVLNAVFDNAAYRRLLDAKLLLTEQDREQLVAQRRETDLQFRMLQHDNPESFDSADALILRRAALDEQLKTPAFNLGGNAALFIDVIRPFGPGEHYETSIAVHVQNAGIIAEAFPYPVIAEDIRIQIDHSTALISAPKLIGPTGAEGSFAGTVLYGSSEDDYHPSLDIRANNLRVDPLLLSALPDSDDEQTDPRRIIARLGIQGEIDCTAKIRPSAAADRDIAYDINIDLDNLIAQPPGAPTALTDLSGKINITPERIALTRMTAGFADALLAFDFSIGFDADPTISGALSADRLDLAAPIEHVVGAIVPSLLEPLAEIRTQYAPEGTLDALISVDGSSQNLDYSIRLSSLTNTSFNTSIGRSRLTETSGDIQFDARDIAFDDFTAQLELDGAPAGFMSLNGDWRTTQTTTDALLTATLAGTTFDAPIIRSLTDSAGPAAQEWITRHNPRGIMNVQADITSNNNQIQTTNSRVSPRSLTIDIDEHTLDFPTASGWLTLADTGAHFEDLFLAAEGWSTTINGSIKIDPSPQADLLIDMETRGLPESLIDVLPVAVIEALDAIELEVQGVLSFDDATLHFTDQQGQQSTRFSADLAYSGASINAGIKIDQLSGVAHLDIASAPDAAENRLDAVIHADTLRAFAVEMTDARATVSRADKTSPFLVHDVSAIIHSGLLTAEALINPSSPDADGRYRVDVEAIDIDLASLLEQVNPDETGPETDPSSGERGHMDLSIAIEGTAHDPDSRRGRGLARVQGGDVLGVPGAMPLIRLSNLQLPFGEPLSFAYADFYIAADAVQITDMQLLSESIAVVGAGSLALEDMALDLRFHSRGRNRVPIVSDLIEGMRDEFVTAVVQGTLRDPEFTYEQFSGTRKMLDAIFSSRPSNPRTVQAEDNNQP